jgi:hypothetical protein
VVVLYYLPALLFHMQFLSLFLFSVGLVLPMPYRALTDDRAFTPPTRAAVEYETVLAAHNCNDYDLPLLLVEFVRAKVDVGFLRTLKFMDTLPLARECVLCASRASIPNLWACPVRGSKMHVVASAEGVCATARVGGDVRW